MALLIGLAQQFPNCLSRLGLPESSNKAIVPENPGHVFQSAEMVARPILRRDQQNKDMHWLSVQAVESDPISGQGQRADQLVHTGMLGVRNGHAPPNSRGAQ